MGRTVKLVALGLIVAVALVMGTTALAQIFAVTEYLAQNLAEIEDHPEGYILRERDGFIGVYYKGRPHPAYLTRIPLSSLRAVDRAEIQRGLIVETRTELIQVLEDFGS